MVDLAVDTKCPACGSTLSQQGRSAGLCPGCLLELALESPSLMAELESPDGEETLAYSREAYSPGQILGKRYRIRALLGRGGMGEVWRAYDLKLRVDVALKALRRQLLADDRALETLRQEVRVAREVVSPNVCRVFDLVELDGQELVSMEYIEGITLLEVLQMRAPFELPEAREIAAQFLAGLGAIHEAGLVHRDLKPENLMITRSGRVVLMDFGIAKGLAEGATGTVSGTPAYMAPEQARGEELDARADVFSAGVVLAEMIAPEGLKTFEARQQIWQGIHHEPPQLPDSPWGPVLKTAVATQREERPASAAALARALEEVTLRVAGAEDLHPYPGLASFTEENAEFFFGRELEVEAMWKKLRRPHLLGLIGPSGAGKSSFLRAGLLPVIPTGWRAVITTPGSRPFAALARVLAGEFSGQTGVVEMFLDFDEPDVAVSLFSRWRQHHDHALVILDQFEELFTLNPPAVQARFAELLSRLALEADVHVLLSMRDDFLFHCSNHETLAPVFSEMTPLKSLSEASLRRAVVQPALKCGYRFEDEALLDEMVEEVHDERGALPMLAFAAARLWDHRDRDEGLLTWQAYEHIGGVGGALAQHAEATLERIGQDRIPVVRELFRNLVTAQGTRAARDREDLLSVFRRGHDPAEAAGHVPSADRVLDTLIDARLLTSYEVTGEEGEDSHHRIEIVHESLLSAWPRLVRWQTQDQEGAQLRDELRQQAQVWEQHDRSQDYLWTGTAFQEFQLWRQRYPGAVSATEEAFGQAMTTNAERRKRRRRIAVTSIVLLAVVVATVMGGLWLRSEAETRRAEAAKLLALAQLHLEEDPTESLAYTTASLGLADTEEARIFALRTLGEAPPAFEVEPGGYPHRGTRFSPDASRLAVAGHSEEVLVLEAEGGAPLVLPGHMKTSQGANSAAWFSNQLLVTGHWMEGRVRIWSFPGGELIRQIDFGGPTWWHVGENRLFSEVIETDDETGHEVFHLRSWQLPDGEPEEWGAVDRTELGSTWSFFDLDQSGWVYGKGNEIFHRPLPIKDDVPDRFVGSHENESAFGGYPTEPNRFWTRDAVTGEMREWDLSRGATNPKAVLLPLESAPEGRIPDASGRWAVHRFWQNQERHARVWDLEAWREARPLRLRRSGSWSAALTGFHPRGDWLVVTTHEMSRLTFWPLRRTWPTVVDGYSSWQRFLVFSPDGRWIVTSWTFDSDILRLWPLPGNDSREVRTLALPEKQIWATCAFDPESRYLFLVGSRDRAYIVPLDGSPPRKLEGFSDDTILWSAAVSPSGRQVATAFGSHSGERTLRVWDLEADELRLFDLPETDSSKSVSGGGLQSLVFADESTLYSAGDGGVSRWNLDTGAQELVSATEPDHNAAMVLAADRRTAIVKHWKHDEGYGLGPFNLLDLVTGQEQALPAHSEVFDAFVAVDDSGIVVASGDDEGIIRVGRVDGGEPHLLVGHEGVVQYVAISPDGRWIASTGEDSTLRLWPMPDLDQPPLHTLPLEELIAKLKSLTNIRVVRDPEAAEGWTVTLDPFPGWAEVPEW